MLGGIHAVQDFSLYLWLFAWGLGSWSVEILWGVIGVFMLWACYEHFELFRPFSRVEKGYIKFFEWRWKACTASV